MIRTQYHATVKIVRTDNRLEFLSKVCQNSLSIIHHKTCPHTPQQNGVMERKHRHLLQVTCSLLFQSSLPKHFWGYALLYATFLINRLPTKLLSWKTPFKMIFGKQPNYQPLKVFGCLCYIVNTKPHKVKLAPRANPCIFLGFREGIKAYKMYDLTLYKIIVARDVVFHESKFPYLNSTSHDNIPLCL